MIGASARIANDRRNERGAIAQSRGIDVVESRTAVPQRLPSGVRQAIAKHPRVTDECTFYGIPIVEVFNREQREDENGRQQQKESGIGKRSSLGRDQVTMIIGARLCARQPTSRSKRHVGFAASLNHITPSQTRSTSSLYRPGTSGAVTWRLVVNCSDGCSGLSSQDL